MTIIKWVEMIDVLPLMRGQTGVQFSLHTLLSLMSHPRRIRLLSTWSPITLHWSSIFPLCNGTGFKLITCSAYPQVAKWMRRPTPTCHTNISERLKQNVFIKIIALDVSPSQLKRSFKVTLSCILPLQFLKLSKSYEHHDIAYFRNNLPFNSLHTSFLSLYSY